MTGVDDHDALAAALGGRPVRTWPAVVSLEAVAQAWAREGGPDGGVVLAGYQVSPRGRGGRPWAVEAGRDLALSCIVRPQLAAEEEGLLYSQAVLAVSDILVPTSEGYDVEPTVGPHGDAGPDERVAGAAVEWPDSVVDAAGTPAGSVSVHAELDGPQVSWAVVSFLLVAPPDRAVAGRLVLEAFDRRRRSPATDATAALRRRCRTLGRSVAARLVPLGPAGPVVRGTAVDVLDDGALLVETPRGHRVAVRPQHLGVLDPGEEVPGPHDGGPPDPGAP